MTAFPHSTFARRHLGPDPGQVKAMLAEIGCASLDDLIDQVVPADIRHPASIPASSATLDAMPASLTEQEALLELRGIMQKNQLLRSFIGLGYHASFTPPVIQRNILENPGWYTAYTPYQAEISQGRLEALLNFQTLITDLTGLEVANASLLDEGSACAEACAMAINHKPGSQSIILDAALHSHVTDVVKTRMEPLGIQIILSDLSAQPPSAADLERTAAIVTAYPDTHGGIRPLQALADLAHQHKALFIVSADLLSLTLLTPPGEQGADICIGNSQRFGVPLGFGGPHAAFMAVTDALKRRLPGRLVGISKDAHGRPAYRLSLQTREQHIRREKATSNICTAQVLLAVIAANYAVYHGPDGLRAIALRIHQATAWVADILQKNGYRVLNKTFFDTLNIAADQAPSLISVALEHGINLRLGSTGDTLVIALDECITADELIRLAAVFGIHTLPPDLSTVNHCLPADLLRSSSFLQHPVFNRYHSETEMMRYLYRLQQKDIALNRSMIPLGSCTMKLNAAAEMLPLTWPEVGSLHPFVPPDQARGYMEIIANLEHWLAVCTGLPAVSLQPNAGSQGEYAGLLAIRSYHLSRGDGGRKICLIPTSAHGTNPASAVMAGFQVVAIPCDEAGNIDLAKAQLAFEKYDAQVAALMVTYPSTHGVFETSIRRICELAHQHGAQVYMDGANLNAQLGLTSPGFIGADVCHLNLHKTFCIPHGGGGPGVGPIAVAQHLAPFLPGHRMDERRNEAPVCSAAHGSASILTISWMYLRMMGRDLPQAATHAILNANYIAARLDGARVQSPNNPRTFFPLLYTGAGGYVAHECIIDLRPFKKITVEDLAKRLMDFGYHAPTMSWPVPGTLMIEPTESESKTELDRFCEAMIAIHAEITAIENDAWDAQDNPLKNAPHTAEELISSDWSHAYTREQAAFPLPWVRADKYWPPVSRIDNVHGDRHLICTCQTEMDEIGD